MILFFCHKARRLKESQSEGKYRITNAEYPTPKDDSPITFTLTTDLLTTDHRLPITDHRLLITDSPIVTFFTALFPGRSYAVAVMTVPTGEGLVTLTV
jgi:hypothetical protein